MVETGQQPNDPLLVSRNPLPVQSLQQLTALPSIVKVLGSLQSRELEIRQYLESRSKGRNLDVFVLRKNKCAVVYEMLKREYISMMRGGGGLFGEVKHAARIYSNKSELIATLQQAEVLQSMIPSAKSMRDVINGWRFFLAQQEGHMLRFMQESNAPTVSETNGAAALELLALFSVMAVIAAPPQLPTYSTGHWQPQAGWNGTADDDCEPYGRQQLLKGAPRHHMGGEEGLPVDDDDLFGFKLILLDDVNWFTFNVIQYLVGFSESTDPAFHDLSKRMLTSYQELLGCIITQLKVQIDRANTIQSKILTSFSTAAFALISFGFQHRLLVQSTVFGMTNVTNNTGT